MTLPPTLSALTPVTAYSPTRDPLRPQVPFAMIRPGPDTTDVGPPLPFYHCGGYYYPDNIIRVFSHTHMVGGAVWNVARCCLLPVACCLLPLVRLQGCRCALVQLPSL